MLWDGKKELNCVYKWQLTKDLLHKIKFVTKIIVHKSKNIESLNNLI